MCKHFVMCKKDRNELRTDVGTCRAGPGLAEAGEDCLIAQLRGTTRRLLGASVQRSHAEN